MNLRIIFAAGMFLLVAAGASSRDQHASLLPKLQPGQTLTYLIRYRSNKNVKTESRVVIPLAPAASQMDTHGLLRIQILNLQQAGGGLSIRARAQFLNDDADVSSTKPVNQKSKSASEPLTPKGEPIEFTISPHGFAEKISGFDALSPEQQEIWQEWLARFAVAWALPAPRAKIGEKWKAEQPVQTGSPIAALIWVRDSSYVRNESCGPAQLSRSGEASPSSAPLDKCAVLLTSAKLVQKSSPKDATPEDFKLHELKTMGTAKGSNDIISYISLSTGLVVRATEEAAQQMDVVVAKVDGSNRVHYNVDAKSQLEVLLLTEAPQVQTSHP